MNSYLFVGTTSGLAVYAYSAAYRRWECIRRALAGSAIRAIVAVDAQTLLVALDDRAPQQSFDGGMSWIPAPGAAPEAVGLKVATLHGPVALANPRLSGATAYARLAGSPPILIGAGAGGMMLFLSEDDGIHWSPARIEADAIGSVTTIIPASDRAGSAWAGCHSGAILRSDDRGRTWRLIANETAPALCMAAANDS